MTIKPTNIAMVALYLVLCLNVNSTLAAKMSERLVSIPDEIEKLESKNPDLSIQMIDNFIQTVDLTASGKGEL